MKSLTHEMSATTPILRLDRLALGYPGRGDVFRGLRAELRPGELVSLLGANGSGKSTLLKALCGNLRPTAGHVEVNGKRLSQLSAMERARLVSIVTTDKAAAGGLTVEELVAMGRYPHTGPLGRHSAADRRIIAEAIDAVGLTRLAYRLTATLSDGERQKAMIARALAQDTPVMLLDEPTAFLDAASRIEILSLLRDLAAGKNRAILLSTHDISPAVRLSTRLWLVKPATPASTRNTLGASSSPSNTTVASATPSVVPEAEAEGSPCLASEGNSPLSILVTGTPAALAADPEGLPSLFPGRHVRFSTSTCDYHPR